MIAVQHLTFFYEDTPTPALDDVSLEIHAGEFVAFIGPNGSGKSTLAKHFNGLLKPTRGGVTIDGADTTTQTIGQLAATVGYVFQNPDHQIFAPTVRAEIEFGLKNLGLDEATRAPRIEEALARFNLHAFENYPPAILGYGLRRQVTLAAVYAMRPRVWVLDEPTSGLDAKLAQEVFALASAQNHAGDTIVFITHDMRLVAEFAARVVVLQEGHILADDTPRAIFRDAPLLSAASILPPQITRLAQTLAMPPDILSVDEFYAEFQQRRRINSTAQ